MRNCQDGQQQLFTPWDIKQIIIIITHLFSAFRSEDTVLEERVAAQED